MKYGYFDDASREYVITTPKTPVKWVNYIGTLDFGGFVDQTGSGVICKGDPALNRIVKYIPQLPLSDMNGETFYIRLKTKDGYKLFSPFFTPVRKELDKYECRVGLGYSRYYAECEGIAVALKITVPRGQSCVLRKITVKNIGKGDVKVDAIPVVEYTHFDALKQFTNADWVPQTMESRLIGDGGFKVLKQYAFMNKGIAENYFCSSAEVSSFETDRAKFLGDGGYGSWSDPFSLKEEELSNTQVNRGDNIAALMIHLPVLKVGEEYTFMTQLGQTEGSAENSLNLIKELSDVSVFDKAMAEQKSFWDLYLDVMQIETPDVAMNAMLNIHNPRQCYITKNWSRYLSLYQLGLGARGMGFRDSSQDVMGILAGAPEEGKDLLVKLLSVQKRNGSAMHQFNPLTMIANEGDSREEEDRPDYYGDDHLWVVLASCAYMNETGNFDFLDESIPFYDKDKEGNCLEEGTVFEHLRRALEFTHSSKGDHGLPLLGFADWNDTVNLHNGAESLHVANLFGWGAKELAGICEFIGKKDDAIRFSSIYEEMKKAVNDHAWDGDWYVRYFDYDGSPIGSKANQYGSIFTNGQSWPVMSGFAEGERAEKAMDSVNKHLNTSKGIKLSGPGYNGYNSDLGGVTTYPPGAKENGGIFLHSNPWVMIAETKLGHGNRAYEYYSQINPAGKNDIVDEYECEPYCYVQNILGDEHPQFGLGRNSWLSGTSSWIYQAATKYILGIRPVSSGLMIDPCIPSEWEGFKIKRVFRGITFNIEVENPDSIEKGIVALCVNGSAIDGNILKASDYRPGDKVIVQVVMKS